MLHLPLLLLLVALVLGASAGSARAGPVEDGQALFEQKCSSCHTIGEGDRVGPDLKGITERRDGEWLRRFIKAPDELIAAGDPIATELLDKYGAPMPNLGLSDAEVDALIAYLGAQGGTAPPPTETAPAETAPAPEPAPAPAGPGDADAGKNLFTGAERFDNGGPPCMSCHSIAGLGALGGGALGPELTGAYSKYGGDAGVASVLASLPFPTMQPIFAGQPLTSQEQADLAAFLAQADQAQRPASAAGKLIGLAFGAVALLAVLALVVWRRRLVAVRRSLVNRSNPRRK